MAEEARKASGIEKFDDTDFAYWRMQIEDYLYGRKLHVLGVIRLILSRSVAQNVVKEKTTTDLIKALSGMYEKSSANNKVHLMKKLFNLKMADNASVAQHLNEFNTITNQLSSVEIDFDDEIRALIVLASLPSSWETMRMTEIHRRDAGETSGSGSALNLETKDREEVHDALLLAVDSPLDDWVLDSGASIGCCGSRRRPNIVANGFVWLMEKVTKGARVLARGKKTGTLYMTSSPRDTIVVADASTDTSLWHRKLGHMSEKGMKMLLSKGKLPELKTSKAEKLELVHTDLWRPSLIASLGGSRYYITFIDDSSRKGIMMKKTIPRTPQQNGVAERMNRTLNERARSYVQGQVNCSDVIEIDKKKSEFVNLDELTESTVQKRSEEDKENVNSQVDLSTPVAEVRISSRNIRPPQHMELTELPIGKKVLHNKWVYRIKNEHDGSKRYKTRLVVKGFQQKEGIDYTEIFSPVVKMSTIRLVLGMVAAENLHLEQLDVNTTFLHGDLEEDFYMIQLEGFIV
ncbi:Retrovirus-related Pol polyprotein from transposon TNT 1-94 [Vitis vinifera]|uniref:Retrovirus-related Pol polyprotein from transposon TNT 1-94 n=1 Tax=Vitis vinifera TaxID=29760 RepID=A0A438J549_VITVI|nr:Retrovirus-related Pol polyprotein from transposon TNT 1-94 [Vitis vinifera]